MDLPAHIGETVGSASGAACHHWPSYSLVCFRRSKITSVLYGVDTDRFGEGFTRATWNRNTDDHDGIATDRIPQITNAKIEYRGDLAAGKWISLVDDSLYATRWSNAHGRLVGNPCMYPTVATAAATAGGTAHNKRQYSGVMQGQTLSGAAGATHPTVSCPSELIQAPCQTATS